MSLANRHAHAYYMHVAAWACMRGCARVERRSRARTTQKDTAAMAPTSTAAMDAARPEAPLSPSTSWKMKQLSLHGPI